MSKKRGPKTGKELAAPEPADVEHFQLFIHKSNNLLTLKDPRTGNEVKVTATIVEEDESEEEEPKSEGKLPPLSVEDFRAAFQELSELGISWTADYPPRIRIPKEPGKSFYDRFQQIQQEYPLFPHELGSVIFYSLTGRKPSFPAGNKEEIGQKLEALGDLVTDTYRSEFFFKYAIKVPYFDNLDWEVVVKTYEKNVQRMPRIAYAILSLVLREPVDFTLPLEQVTNEPREPEFLTVAVNEQSVDRLIRVLTDVKKSLNKAQRIANAFSEEGLEEAKTDGTDESK